jgi:hypothetical protein
VGIPYGCTRFPPTHISISHTQGLQKKACENVCMLPTVQSQKKGCKQSYSCSLNKHKQAHFEHTKSLNFQWQAWG